MFSLALLRQALMPPQCGWAGYAAPPIGVEELLSGFSCRSGFTFGTLLGAFFTVMLATVLTSVLASMLFSFLAFFGSSRCSGFRSSRCGNSRCGRSSSFLSKRRNSSAHQSDSGKSCEQTTRNHSLNLQYNRLEFLGFYCTIPCVKP